MSLLESCPDEFSTLEEKSRNIGVPTKLQNSRKAIDLSGHQSISPTRNCNFDTRATMILAQIDAYSLRARKDVITKKKVKKTLRSGIERRLSWQKRLQSTHASLCTRASQGMFSISLPSAASHEVQDAHPPSTTHHYCSGACAQEKLNAKVAFQTHLPSLGV